MPIVPSRSGRIQELLSRLASGGPAERDSAVAGLTLLGTRVIEPLRAVLPNANREARLCAVEVLDRIEDHAALTPLLDLSGDEDEAVARRAMEALGGRPDPRAARALAGVLAGPGPASRRRCAALALVRLQAAGLVEALDPLAARLLDEREDAAGLRVAILDALRPGAAAGAGHAAAAAETAGRVRRPATRRSRPLDHGGSRPPGAARGRARRTRAVRRGRRRTTAVLALRGAPAIPALQQALERLSPPGRGGGDTPSLRARAAIHEALAALDSRVALYDLRETLATRPRAVMPALLRATGRIGDAWLVPLLARAVTEERALLEPCAEALAAIVARERLRKTSAACRSVRPDDRSAFLLLWEAAKTSRRR